MQRFLGKEGSVKRRVLLGYSWTVVTAVGAKLIAVMASYYIARVVGQIAFGELGILQNTINTLGVFAGFGIGVAATKFIAQYRVSEKEKASRILTLNLIISIIASAIMALLVLAFSEKIAQLIANEGLNNYLKIGALTLFFASINGALSGILAGLERFRLISILAFFTTLISSSLQCILVGSMELWGVIVGITVAQICTTFFSILILKRELAKFGLYIIINNLKTELKTLFHFNVPTILGSLMVSPVNWISAAYLVNQDAGYSEMGMFTAANQWRLALLFIPLALSKVLLSIMSNLNEQGNEANMRRLMQGNIFAVFIISIFLVLGSLLFGDYIMSGYGEEFRGGQSVLTLLVAVAGLTAVNSIIGTSLQSKGLVWYGLMFNFIWAIQLLIWAYFLCPMYGAIGLALANFFAYLGHSLIQFSFINTKKYQGA